LQNLGSADVRTPLADRCKEVDEVAVGIAEQHRPVSPWLRSWFQDKLDSFETRPRSVHIIDLEFDDCRSIGRRSSRTGVVQIHGSLTTDGEDTHWGSELDVVVISDGLISVTF
jgi:hypothetical protein